MSFPIGPSDNQLYTNALGTVYKYVAADGKWIIVSQEIQGYTGAQGVTGLVGPQGATGTSFVYGGVYNAGNFGSTGAILNLNNGYSQKTSLIAGGSTGLIYLSGGMTGAKYSVEFSFNANAAPRGSTGIKWSPAEPVLSGYTGVKDMVYIYASGQDYIGVASMGHTY